MKPKKANGKLSLNKKTIVHLNNDFLNNVKGKTGPTTSPWEDCTDSCIEFNCPDPTNTCCTCATCACISNPLVGCGGGGGGGNTNSCNHTVCDCDQDYF